MPYFVAEGRSITTKRGIVGADHENPEITLACLGVDPKDAEAKKAAAVRLAALEEKGYLIKAKESPIKVAEAEAEKARADAAAETAKFVEANPTAKQRRKRGGAQPAEPKPEADEALAAAVTAAEGELEAAQKLAGELAEDAGDDDKAAAAEAVGAAEKALQGAQEAAAKG